jgi:hypothetical protein
MAVPFAFANLSGNIALSKLDSNFNTPITIGNTSVQLGGTITTLNNMTLSNVTISGGTNNVTETLANVTTLNATSAFITTGNISTANVGNLTLLNALTVPNGGTGMVTLPANSVLLGNGTSPVISVAPGTAGNVLTSIGGVWTSNAAVGGGGGGNVTGSGAYVLAVSPTITTPIVSGNMTVNGLRLGKGISSGVNNTVFGLSAGNAQTTGVANTLVGMNAGYLLTSGTQNTFFGRSAGAGVTTQNNNTCIGYNTAIGSAIGANNTAIGHYALFDTTSTTATFNTAVGSNALSTLGTYTNCSGLGNDAEVTGDNQIQLGDSATTTYVYGTVQNRSDIRDKADVRDTQLGLAFINALRPVDYKLDMRDDYKPPQPEIPEYPTDPEYKIALSEWREACNLSNLTHNGSKKRSRYHHGLIAQEVKAVLDAQGIDFGGYQDHKVNGGQDVLSIGYDELIAPLIKSIQELTARIAQLEAK